MGVGSWLENVVSLAVEAVGLPTVPSKEAHVFAADKDLIFHFRMNGHLPVVGKWN